MSKQATVIVLHVGRSMSTCFKDPVTGEQVTRFDSAMKAVDKWVEHLAMFGGQDEMGLVLFGTDETEHDLDEDTLANVTVFNQVEKGSLVMLNKLSEISSTDCLEGDSIGAMIVGLDMLEKRTKNKKYQRQIILITDCGGINTKLDQTEVSTFFQCANACGCSFKMIGIDLLVKPDFLSSSESSELSLEKSRWARSSHLFTLVSTESNNCIIQKPGSVQELLGYLPRRTRCKTKTYSKELTLTKLFKMNVHIFKYTTEQKFPSAKKMSTLAPEEGQDKVVRHIVHKSKQNDVDEEISPDDLVKAYPYGKEMVPFTEADVVSMAYKSNYGLSIIGFTDKKDINRAQFLNGADIILPHNDDVHAATSMSAIVRAMQKEQVYAVARYVVKDNKGPSVVCLSPHVETDSSGRLLEGLILNTLPFAEDLRPFRFKSLDKVEVTKEQLAAADALIDSMDLSKASTNGTEALSPHYTYNPTLQYFYTCLSTRARNKSSKIVPDDDAASSSSSTPPSSSKLEHNLQLPHLTAPDGCFHGNDLVALKEFKSKFPTVLRDDSSKKRKHWGANKSKKEQQQEQEGDRTNSSSSGGGGSNDAKRARYEPLKYLTSSKTSVNEFNTTLQAAQDAGDLDQCSTVFREMKSLIEMVAFDEASNNAGENRLLLISMLTAIRKGAIDCYESAFYNRFARAFRIRCAKDNVTNVWSWLVESSNGLITTGEALGDGEGASDADAKDFLAPLNNDISKKESTNNVVSLEVDDDLDMDDLE